MAKQIEIKSPVDGKVILAKSIKDPVFAQEMMGPTFAVVPSSDNVLSPIDGKVVAAFPTGHAYGIQHKKGVELLVHIGIDTVELDGKGFDSKVTQGSKTKEGNVLATVDFQDVAKKKSTDVILIITNSADYKLEITKKGNVKAGDIIAVLTK